MKRNHIIATAYNNGLNLVLRQGSSLDVQADCLVNAANERLDHGGGVALEIATNAGHLFNARSREWVENYGEIIKGGTAVLDALNLRSFKKVINAVGPKQDNSEGRQMLISTIVNSLKEADLNGYSSISIPALSVGIFGFPKDSSALRHFEAFLIFSGYKSLIKNLNTVIISLFTDEEASIFAEKFLEFSAENNFQKFEYYGTIKEVGLSPNNNYCQACQSNYPADFFLLTNCCRGICDFCITKSNGAFCFKCNTPRAPDRANHSRCIQCRNIYETWAGCRNCRVIK